MVTRRDPLPDLTTACVCIASALAGLDIGFYLRGLLS